MINSGIDGFTVTQLEMAAGLARGMDRRAVCTMLNVTNPYFTKCLRREEFVAIINEMIKIPIDAEMKPLIRASLRKMAGYLIYHWSDENDGNGSKN
jgi:hypothetical protein